MRFLKLSLISIVIFLLLFVAFSLLLPSHVRISRAVNINAPISEIQPHIASLDKWASWNTLLSDTSIRIVSIGSRQIKADKLDIQLKASKADSVFTTWSQPNGKSFDSNFSFASSAGVTVVQWYFDFHFKWPWEKFGSLVYDNRMGPDMEKSLTRLKGLVETSP